MGNVWKCVPAGFRCDITRTRGSLESTHRNEAKELAPLSTFLFPFKSLMDWPGICWVCDRAEHYMALTKGHEYGEALTHASLRRFYRHMTLQRQQSGYRLMLCPLRYSNWKNAPFPFHFGPQTKPGMCLKTLTHIWAHVLAITQYRCRRWPVSIFIYQKKFG